MNLREQAGWWVSGQTAKIAVEDYNDTADAILYPFMFTGAAWAAAYAAGQLTATGGFLPTASAVFLGLFTIAFVTQAALSAVASYEYATEPTRDAQAQEVSA